MLVHFEDEPPVEHGLCRSGEPLGLALLDERAPRLPFPHLRLQRGQLAGGDVGRVRDDEVERPRQACEEISLGEDDLELVRLGVLACERERQAAEQAATRSAQVGTGARAEKIRTYNFPENRVTDHRIKLTTHRLDQVLQGDLAEYTDALTADQQRRSLEG